MKTMRLITGIALGLMFLGGAALAEDKAESNEPLTAAAGFERMLALEGVWEGESNTVPAGQSKDEGTKSKTTVIYESIANDTSVIATYAKDTPMEMVSMYHMDGPEALVHTHYCAVGNQPSMRFVPSENPNEIVMKFSGGTNMDVEKDGHVHDATIRFLDDGTIETETVIWTGGKHSHTRYATLKRVE